ncbi:hypothetical protein PENTCL1PPCAC_25393, partial [Pristionchus entomophagus]
MKTKDVYFFCRSSSTYLDSMSVFISVDSDLYSSFIITFVRSFSVVIRSRTVCLVNDSLYLSTRVRSLMSDRVCSDRSVRNTSISRS